MKPAQIALVDKSDAAINPVHREDRKVGHEENTGLPLSMSGSSVVVDLNKIFGPKAMFFKIRLSVAAQAGITWKPNILRHSFISYRLAEIQDVNRVALEAGNSPQMIFRHYRELATPKEARTWFQIRPRSPANVVPLRLAK